MEPKNVMIGFSGGEAQETAPQLGAYERVILSEDLFGWVTA